MALPTILAGRQIVHNAHLLGGKVLHKRRPLHARLFAGLTPPLMNNFGDRISDGVLTVGKTVAVSIAQTAPRSDGVGMSTILLTGATGNVTSAVIRSLQGSGHRLIGLVRDPAKAKDLAAQGVELRTGDLSLLRTVEGAFEGVDVAWLLTPPGPSAPIQASNALWAARLGGVKHVVRMSAVGAAHDAPNLNSRLHALSDAEIAGCGLSFTVVKPHFFMQNLMMAAQSVAEQGTIYFALGDAKLPMVDVRDIGGERRGDPREPCAARRQDVHADRADRDRHRSGGVGPGRGARQARQVRARAGGGDGRVGHEDGAR